MYLGGGIGFETSYGFGTDATGSVALGTSAFALVGEVGYAIALFDFLHLSIGLLGQASLGHVAGVDTSGNVVSGFLPAAGGGITAGVGIAF